MTCYDSRAVNMQTLARCISDIHVLKEFIVDIVYKICLDSNTPALLYIPKHNNISKNKPKDPTLQRSRVYIAMKLL